MAKWNCPAISLAKLVRVVRSSYQAPCDATVTIGYGHETGPSIRCCLKCRNARAGKMMMDQSLASLVTRERDDYFGRFFHSLGASQPRFSVGEGVIDSREFQLVEYHCNSVAPSEPRISLGRTRFLG